MRPFQNILSLAMFYRIGMYVFDVVKQVPIIAYLMLPISTLPDPLVRPVSCEPWKVILFLAAQWRNPFLSASALVGDPVTSGI